jgi:putative ABC transport system substrate-binding protein
MECARFSLLVFEILHESVVRRNILSIVLFFILFQGVAEAEQAIVAVQSIRVAPYEQAFEGFQSVCSARITRLVISELKGADVAEAISGIRPDMVLAIGMDALSRVKAIKKIPVVYLMVLNPQSILYREGNITGVDMNIPPDTQLGILREALPGVKSVGLLYDPKRTGLFVKAARNAARRIGIDVVAMEVHHPREVPSALNAMRGTIDIFWMLPDLTVVTPETVELFLMLSLEDTIPILTFSQKYVELGALLSIGIDAFDIGRQAGEMANPILSGRNTGDIQPVDARKAVISVNLKVAQKLGIVIDTKIVRKARVVH